MKYVSNTYKSLWLIGALALLTFTPFTTTKAQTKNIFFESKAAFSKLNRIKKQDFSKIKNLEATKSAANKLEKLQDQAKTCVDETNGQLAILNNLIESLQSINKQDDIQTKEEFKYFKSKKDNYTQQVINCRLFIFQSQETLSTLNENIQRITTQTKLMRAVPIWNMLDLKLEDFNIQNIRKLYDASGLAIFTSLSPIISLAIIAMLSLLLAIFIRKRCTKWLEDNKTQEKQKTLAALIAIIKKYSVSIILLGSISCYLAIIFASSEITPSLELISYSLLIYSTLIASLSFILSPPEPASPITKKLQKIGPLLFSRLKILLTLLVTASIITIVIDALIVEETKAFFLLLVSSTIAWIIWPFISLPILERTHKKISVFIKYALTTILASAFILQTIGYYRLSLHIMLGSLFIILTFSIIHLLIIVINKTEEFIHNKEGKIAKAIRQHLGIRHYKKITEFIFIKISLYLIALYGLIIALLGSLGVSLNYIDKLNDAFMNGFVLVKTKIIPFQVILALFVFGALLILGRWTTNTITKKHRTEKDRQDVMASLLGYISFCIALIVALIIAGIDFTGLAFIVGALSVGIGLGLQNIVNNFISGIILLVEKSIKPGDRIIVNGKEGFVKQIRLRSTQITTLAKEDIIVPNSNFITEQVINYTFKDNLTRVSCKVGVSYDSDIELVEKTLLKIASLHPDVIQDEFNKPAVLFNEFADSSLNFSLYCTIDDANKRYRIMSDLNTAIFKEFKKLGIEISYPQLDVNMKNKID